MRQIFFAFGVQLFNAKTQRGKDAKICSWQHFVALPFTSLRLAKSAAIAIGKRVFAYASD
jgi:hypothetical protein